MIGCNNNYRIQFVMATGNTPSYHRGQVPVRTTGQMHCILHNNKILELFCETCNDVVCTKCLSTSHKGHDVVELSDVTSKFKTEIQTFINDTEKKKVVEIQQSIKSTDEKIEKNCSQFKKLADELQKQGQELKQEIDIIIAKNLSLYEQLEEKNSEHLKTYKLELQEKLGKIEIQVKHCKKVLQTGKDLEVFDVRREIHDRISCPVEPTLGTAKFSPNKLYHKHLQKLFGKFSLNQPGQPQDHSQHQSVSDHGPSAGKSDTQQASETQQQQSNSPLTLLSKTEILLEFDSPCVISYVCPTSNGVATCDNTDTLTLLDRNGRVQREIDFPVCVRDISASPVTNNIWTCSMEDNSIMELTRSGLKHRFSVESEPWCLCVTTTEHILVGTEHKVTKFNPAGKPILATETDSSAKSFVCTPRKIAHCGGTKAVAIIDRDESDDGGQNRPHLVVLNNNFKELFRFRGYVYQTGLGAFDPLDVTYDRGGNLVIGDCSNHCIHLVNGSGQYIRQLHAASVVILAVCIGRDDTLWSYFSGNKVKLLRYSK